MMRNHTLVLLVVFSLIAFIGSPFSISTSYAGTVNQNSYQMVSGGDDHSLALRNDGTVWAWGNNVWGQLGNGGNVPASTPTEVSGIDNVLSISAGSSSSIALKKDGTVWAWGINSSGQLGNGTEVESSTPVQVTGLDNVIEIADGGNLSTQTVQSSVYSVSKGRIQSSVTSGGGRDYCLALKNDGTVWCWGNNVFGQLGNGTNIESTRAIKVPGLDNIEAVAAGSGHAMALKKDGTVWVWGRNTSGQLGTGNTVEIDAPIQVSGLDNITAIAAGGDHSMALKGDGSLWTWGANTSGQLGIGNESLCFSPTSVSGVNNIVRIAAGGSHSFAVDKSGTVWAWGKNTFGQLGNGYDLESSIPVKVVGLSNVLSIAAGSDFSLAVDNNGALWAWGKNANGQLGDGTSYEKHQPNALTPSGTSAVQNPVPQINLPKLIYIFSNTNLINFDVQPKITNGRLLVPARKLFETFGLNVVWDAATKTVTGKSSNKTIVLKIDSDTAVVDGKDIRLDAPAEIDAGRVLIPMRFIAETLNAKVDWNESTRTAVITTAN